MDDALISIGQFAGLTWLSPKALRLYQSQGLLEPAEIEPTNDQIDDWQRDLDAEITERRQLLDHIARTLDSTEVTPMPTDPSHAQMERAVPVLASLDIEATQRFYAERLGFKPVAQYPDYGIVERDDVQIHFWLTDDADIPKATSCRVDVDGVDQLFEEMSAAGVVHPNGPLTDQPWGLREFAVLDEDGNMIKFGQRMPS